MKLKENGVYTFKLVTTEEITARFIKMDGSAYMIKMPVILAPSEQGMQMYPFIVTGKSEKSIPIFPAGIVMIAECKDEIAEKYIEATTNINVPEKKEIILG